MYVYAVFFQKSGGFSIFSANFLVFRWTLLAVFFQALCRGHGRGWFHSVGSLWSEVAVAPVCVAVRLVMNLHSGNLT